MLRSSERGTCRVAIQRAVVAASALWICAAAPAAAQGHLWPRFGVGLGGYFPNDNAKIQVDVSSELTGTEIDFQNDFGVDDSGQLAYFKIDWLMAERHELSLGYFTFDREGTRRIDRRIEIGDTVYPAGVEVTGRLDNSQLEAVYTYYFSRTDRIGFGLSGGVVWLSLDASTTATLRVGNQTVTREESRDTDLPVPVIGVLVKGEPWNRIVLRASARLLPEVNIGDVNGTAGTYSLGADFYVLNRLAIGASYDGSFYRVDVDKGDWQGKVDFTIDGFFGYVRFAF